jgi:hypothetical protein
MSIYSHQNTKEYLAHIIAILCIIKQKGLNVQCRKLGKAVVKLTRTFKDLLKDVGLKETVGDSKDAPRSPEAAPRSNCQDVQTPEEPPVQ